MLSPCQKGKPCKPLFDVILDKQLLQEMSIISNTRCRILDQYQIPLLKTRTVFDARETQ